MPDETPIGQEEQGTENDSGDPEVPLVPHASPANHSTRKAEIKAHPANRYINHTFDSIMAWVKKYNRAHFWTAAATVTMAITSAFYAYYARGIRQQLYASIEAGKDSRMAQWAYIDIPQQIQIRTTVEDGKVAFWTPEITIVNDGSTGTYNTLEVVNAYSSEVEMSESCSLPDNGKPRHSDIGPHESELFDAPRIPVAAVQSIQSGGHVYLYGRVVYRDVFQFYSHITNGETRHLREFCYELRLDSPAGDVTSPSYVPPKSLVLYGPHNCTDGDCPDYLEKSRTWRYGNISDTPEPPTDLGAFVD
jgi:hypothetical protein